MISPAKKEAQKTKEVEWKDDPGNLKSRHPNTKGPTKVKDKRIFFLQKNDKISGGIQKGQRTEGAITFDVIYCRTKPTGSSPYGEILWAIPSRKK